MSSFPLLHAASRCHFYRPLWREAEEVKVVNDYQVVFRLKRPMSIIPYVASRAGELRIVSKAWDKELRRLKNGRLAPARTATSDAGNIREAGRQPLE